MEKKSFDLESLAIEAYKEQSEKEEKEREERERERRREAEERLELLVSTTLYRDDEWGLPAIHFGEGFDPTTNEEFVVMTVDGIAFRERGSNLHFIIQIERRYTDEDYTIPYYCSPFLYSRPIVSIVNLGEQIVRVSEKGVGIRKTFNELIVKFVDEFTSSDDYDPFDG